MLRTTARIAALLALTSVGACENTTCTALGIVREMTYETTVPGEVDVTSATLQVCFGEVCDTSRLAARPSSNDGLLRCEPVDTTATRFPTSCAFAASERKLTFTTNTVYGGHAGSDRLVVTAVAPSGARTELLRGTVTYEDTTDDAARGACTDAWKGTFTKD